MSEVAATKDIAWARRITERLRIQGTNFQEARDKIIATLHEAQDGGAWELLGYASWPAYISDVFGEEPLRLERDPRREFVAELSEAGMSTRAIAPIVGKDYSTISRDLNHSEVLQHATPASEPDLPGTGATVLDTGTLCHATSGQAREFLDSIQSAPSAATPEAAPEPAPVRKVTGLDGKQYTAPKPQPKERRQNQSALPAQYASAIVELDKAINRIERLNSDERFPRNKENVALSYKSDVQRAVQRLTTIENQLI